MKKTFPTLILGGAFVLAGCEVRIQDDAVQATNETVYTQDTKTNLCFAWQGINMTNVPCTSEVLEQVQSDDTATKPVSIKLIVK
ncbi:MAG: hypothetical protein EP349_07055 [Alphaproteobacteria bacterium]|nr:MAG: hypothetical protein EP349_07055 [Alphaproteobacteria bacterium]